MAKVLKSHIILLCILAAGLSLQAQAGVDIGFTLATMPGNPVRELILDFNKSLPAGAKPMKRMNVIPGVVAGFSYRLEPVIFLAEYQGFTSSVLAKRLVNASGNSYNYLLNLSRNAAGAGIGSMLGDRLTAGIIGSYNWYTSYQFLSTDTKNKSRLIKDQLFGLQPFIDVHLSRQRYLDICLRAFYFHPLGSLRIDKLADKLDPDHSSGLSGTDLDFRPSTVGLSFILKNKR